MRRLPRVLAVFVPLVALAGPAAVAQAPSPKCPPQGPGPSCVIRASVEAGYVLAQAFTPSNQVRYEIYATPGGGAKRLGPITKRTDSSGSQTLLLHELHLKAGNEVVITDVATGTVKRMVVNPIKLLSIDVANDTVSGTAQPGDTVQVGLIQGFFEIPAGGVTMTTADASGAWTADFRSQGVDITTAMSATSNVTDADGDATHGDIGSGCPSPIPHLDFHCSVEAHTTNDLIAAQRMTPNNKVRFEVFSGATSVFGPVTLDTDDRGNTEFVEAGFTTGIDLVPGQRVVARDMATGTVKTLVVAPLTVDRVDTATNVIEGSAPANTTVNTQCTQPVQAPVDAAGKWRVDCLAAQGYDLGDDDAVAALIGDGKGNVTLADRGAPIPDCVPSPEVICGTAGPEALRGETGAAGAVAAAARRVRSINAGRGDDLVLVTMRGSRVTVNTGRGKEDKVVVRPGPRGARGTVVIRGSSQRMVVVLPAHAGSLVARVTGSRGGDEVSTRSFPRRGGRRGGYRISGGRGSDRLRGGSGHDTLIGGPGRDTCILGEGDVARSCEVVRRI